MKSAPTTRNLAFLATSVLCIAAMAACMPLGGEGLEFDSNQPEMVAFQSCGELDSFLKNQAMTKTNWQLNALSIGSTYDAQGFAAAPTTTGDNPDAPVPDPPEIPFDETNLQEAGVDEADIFKVDGTHAFALHGNRLIIIGAIGTPVEPDPTEPEPNPNGGILLEDITDALVVAELEIPGNPIEMFLAENKVVVLTRTNFQEAKLLVEGAAEMPNRPDGHSVLKAVVVDVQDRENPEIQRQVLVDGDYLSSRRIDNQIYVVTNANLSGPDLGSEVSNTSSWLFNRRQSIQSASLDSWMPYVYDARHTANGINPDVRQADCSSTYASKATNGDEAIGIFSFDFTNIDSGVKTTTVMGEGAVVYASRESIVVALTNYAELKFGDQDDSATTSDSFLDGFDFGDGLGDDWGTGDDMEPEPDEEPTNDFEPAETIGREKTYLHRFELAGNGNVAYHATGTVDGWLLNQFSISEHRGYLRVATQVGQESSDSESNVFVLQSRDKSGVLSAPIGPQTQFLDIVGELRGIGLDEDLYATRFQGDIGYLVTFRETDPLWIIDLNEPTKPTLRGHLVVPGYSTYLHPIEGKRLLAIGRAGNNDGIKLSIFDVANLDSPRAVDEIEEGTSNSDSEALTEHRAFRWLSDKKLMFVPMTHGALDQGLFAYKVTESGFEDAGTITHAEMQDNENIQSTVRRAYRIGDYIYAYSPAGVTISSLDTLETAASIDLVDAF